MLEYGEVVTSGQNSICPPPEVVIAKFGSRCRNATVSHLGGSFCACISVDQQLQSCGYNYTLRYNYRRL